MTSVGVTMFFDLKSLPDATDSVRPVDFYVKNGQTTLSQKCPLVILCDKATRPWIEEFRTRLAPGVETVYVERSLMDYEHYRLNHSIIKANRVGNSNYVGSRNTPSYCLTTMLKFQAIKTAHEIFPSASHYFWIDFGCAHIAKDAEVYLPKMLEKPNPKICCMYIHYRHTTDLRRMETYLSAGNPCALAATIFSVENSLVNSFYTRGLAIFYEMLSRGVGHNEEAVLIYLYDRFPEMFHLYYGDYYSTASNYHYVCRDYPAIKAFFLRNTIHCGRLDLARACVSNILESVSGGYLNLPNEELAFLATI